MKMEFRSDFRQPVLWRGGLDRILHLCYLLLFIGTMTRGRIIELNPDGRFTLTNLLILAGYGGIAAFILWPTFRFHRTDFVLDEHGVGLERGGRWKGLAWDDITMYEWHASFMGSYLHLTDRSGRRHAMRLPYLATFHQNAIRGILDSQLAARGHAIELQVPTHELGLRLARYYGAVPPLEMEPNVRYRYTNPDLLKMWAATSNWWMIPLLFSIPWVMLAINLITHSFETGLLVASLYAVPVVGFFVYRKMKQAQFLRRFDDRFILRGGTLYVIRDGLERPLPQSQTSGRRLQGHIFLKYGEGRLAYEIAPQFLEPDPDVTT